MKRWFKSLGHRRCWVAPGIMAVLVLLSAPNMAFAATGDLYGDGTANTRDEDCPDLDGLSRVDFIDFSILAQNWRSIGPDLLGNLNADRIVDIHDLAILAAYWLSDCSTVNVPDIDVVDIGPDSISVDEPTLVTITAHIDLKLDRTDSEVELLRLDANNQIIDTLGYLHDDGLSGDATAGDNIFTIQKIFTEPEPT
ncbi:MAG: choice-of-anchor X domain-containing protein, partial [Thiotrichaceae bacterium]